MFAIGDFARLGRVSVRMLRHYDAIGLLPPSSVDPDTGYRWYDAAALSELNRIVALKDLGFTLEQVRALLGERLGADELRGMLRVRQADLQARIDADAARLRQVETRLRLIEREGTMPDADVVLKRIPGVRIAQLSAVAAGFEPEAITPVIGPLYGELLRRLEQHAVAVTGPGVAWYADAPDGGVVVHAGVPVDMEPDPAYRVEIVDLPPIERAATIVHRGPMDDVLGTLQRLAHWIEANVHRSAGYNRECYLRYTPGDEQNGVTELQEPLS